MAAKKNLNKEMEVVGGLTGNPIGTQLKTADGIFDAIIANPTSYAKYDVVRSFRTSHV
ncbi:MAG: hypothetical protein WCL51_06055 [Bacteroidota bacterium]